jgi:hypothetical protein
VPIVVPSPVPRLLSFSILLFLFYHTSSQLATCTPSPVSMASRITSHSASSRSSSKEKGPSERNKNVVVTSVSDIEEQEEPAEADDVFGNVKGDGKVDYRRFAFCFFFSSFTSFRELTPPFLAVLDGRPLRSLWRVRTSPSVSTLSPTLTVFYLFPLLPFPFPLTLLVPCTESQIGVGVLCVLQPFPVPLVVKKSDSFSFFRSIPSSFAVLGVIPGSIILLFFAAVTTWSDMEIGVFKLNHPQVCASRISFLLFRKHC